MISKMKYLSFILLIALLASCGSNVETQKLPEHSATDMESDFSKCPNGAIPAIFDEDTSALKLITSQNFVAAKGSVTETVTFASGVELTLEQSGCKVLKQRYSFRFPKTPKEENPNFWIALAIAQFDYMSKINQQFGGLRDLIAAEAEKPETPEAKGMQLGQPLQGEDYSLTIDKFPEGEETILVVSFDLIYSY
jgi:hypothetical protein